MLAETIRQAVKTKGWTLRELERRSGVPYDTIYNVVHARRTDPRFSVVAKLVQALDVPLATVVAAVLEEPQAAAAGTPKPRRSQQGPRRDRKAVGDAA